jgi:hypothetical protein
VWFSRCDTTAAIRWDRMPVGPLDLEVEGSEDMTVYERVLDVMLAYELWSDLAIRRLHEIHRLKGQECEFCGKWLDGGAIA